MEELKYQYTKNTYLIEKKAVKEETKGQNRQEQNVRKRNGKKANESPKGKECQTR